MLLALQCTPAQTTCTADQLLGLQLEAAELAALQAGVGCCRYPAGPCTSGVWDVWEEAAFP